MTSTTQVSFTLDIAPELLDESIRQQAEQKARESYVMEFCAIVESAAAMLPSCSTLTAWKY